MPLASALKVYVKYILGLLDQIFLLFSYENQEKKKKIPFNSPSSIEFKMCKNVKFRFRLGTMPRGTKQSEVK